MSAPFVTVGSTPECDACHSYYAERACEDCGENLCTWCNQDRHEPIGKRNHWRPRLYGTDPDAHLERNATASADEAMRAVTGNGGGGMGRLEKIRQGNEEDEEQFDQYTVDPVTHRVTVVTEHVLENLSAREGWDLLGDWDLPFAPWSVDVTSSGDRRVLSLPPPAGDSDSTETVLVTERLIQRNEKDTFYSYSRLVPPAAGFQYTDLQSKWAFVDRGSRGCVLQWTTSVLPKDTRNPHIAAESVARFQESYKPYIDAAAQMED